MLNLGLFLLPLSGGFIFASFWHPTHVSIQRSSGYKLFFVSIAAGVMLLAMASFGRLLILTVEDWLEIAFIGKHVRCFIRSLIPLDHSGKCLFAALLGYFGWFFLNRCCDRTAKNMSYEEEKQWVLENKVNGRDWLWVLFLKGSKHTAFHRAISSKGDSIETLLRDSMYNGNALLVTTKSRKVYLGQVARIHNPVYDNISIQLYVLKSGHRETDKLKVALEEDYISKRRQLAVQELKNTYQNQDLPEDDERVKHLIRELQVKYQKQLIVTIPASEVHTISRYHEIDHETLNIPYHSKREATKDCILYSLLSKTYRHLKRFVEIIRSAPKKSMEYILLSIVLRALLSA